MKKNWLILERRPTATRAIHILQNTTDQEVQKWIAQYNPSGTPPLDAVEFAATPGLLVIEQRGLVLHSSLDSQPIRLHLPPVVNRKFLMRLILAADDVKTNQKDQELHLYGTWIPALHYQHLVVKPA
jgi:hypothetical protein